MKTHEIFTQDEQERLASFVTNTDNSVFALINLPEVIKGALFSRYSRSTLGLRQLLLKDFIQNQESEFDAIQGMNPQSDVEQQALAIGKAQDFYDRILDGYGDDSIGELGGAHLAVENVSILATKVLQDARIGGSPLEKSTRYVTFAKKVDGDYLFYKDPKVLQSQHKDLYLETNRFLFDTYASLIEPMTTYVEKRMPREEGVSEGAYKRSVRAKVFDVIRGILPASTLTNMGVFGNGRFFESLISKLNIQELSELQEIGGSAHQELSKVIPSFVRRSDTEHRHFKSFAQFQQGLKERVQAFQKEHLSGIAAESRDLVELVDYDTDAETKLFAAMLYAHTPYPLSQLKRLVSEIPDAQKHALIEDIVQLREHRRHKPGRELESVYYTFDVLGDYGMYRDLQRHRILSQERQPLSPYFGYHTPEEIEDAGLGDVYHGAMKRAADAYETLAADFPHEAQYLVPLSYNIRWYVKINLRALQWMTELRSTPQGHESYRKVAQDMFLAVQKVHPHLAKYLNFVDLNAYPLGRLDAEIKLDAKAG